MTEAEFNRLAAAGYNRIPLVLETFADLDTPLSIYLKLANQPYSYLLESVVGGERFGRYSFIGLAATTRIEVRGNDCAELRRAARRCSRTDDGRSAGSSSTTISTASRWRAMPRPAALLRRAGRLFRLRHGALYREAARRARQARSARHARHPAAAVRGDRHRRQPVGQAVAGGLCRAGQARRVSRRRARA